jgi:hypothetical protein
MGMFDYVKIKDTDIPYPENYRGEKLDTFQTKSLCNALSTFVIDNGILYEEVIQYELPIDYILITSDSHRESYKKTVKADTFTGEVVFYSYDKYDDMEFDLSIEFSATIVDGIVHKIKLVSYVEHDNSSRKELDEQLRQRLMLCARRRESIFYPVMRFIDSFRMKIRNFFGRLAFKTGSGFNQLGAWIYKRF